MFTHSLAYRLASSAIPRVHSLERSLEPYPHCHSLTTVTLRCVQILSTERSHSHSYSYSHYHSHSHSHSHNHSTTTTVTATAPWPSLNCPHKPAIS